MNRGYASRIDALNNFVTNYDDEYTQNFVEGQKQRYQKKLSDMARENVSELINKQITEEQRLAVENLPIFYNESKKALTTFKKRFDKKGKETQEGGEPEKISTTDDVEMKNMGDIGTPPVAETETRNVEPVIEDPEIEVRNITAKTRVSVPEDFNPLDVLGGKPVLSENRATSTLDDALLGGGPSQYIEQTEGGLQRAGMTLNDAAQGLKTSIGKAATKAKSVLDEGATAITSSAGDIAAVGGTAVGSVLTGLGGYETGKELGASKGASIGIGVAEGALAIAAPELAIPLAVGDILVSGIASLFGSHHHSHHKAPPPPQLMPTKPPPPPVTAQSRGTIATPVMNV